MRTQRFFELALMAGFMLGPTLISAPRTYAQTLGSGTYRVEVRNVGSVHSSVWRLQVSGNQISGTSEWENRRVNAMSGYISGNRVQIQRDCRPGFTGPCQQTYYGTIGNGVIQGSFTGTGAAPNNVWRLHLGAVQPSYSGLEGTWKYSASCVAPHTGPWTGFMYFNLRADGTYAGKASGSWVNTNSADIGGGTVRGNEVSFNFNPTGWTSYYIWKGQFISDGSGIRIQGTAYYYGGKSCNFIMTR